MKMKKLLKRVKKLVRLLEALQKGPCQDDKLTDIHAQTTKAGTNGASTAEDGVGDCHRDDVVLEDKSQS